MTGAIHAEHLTKRFGDFTAVDDVSFDVAPGEIFGFLGPNGSGKSTVIRMLCAILAPTSGTATLLGRDIHTDPDGIKSNTGYMSQAFSLYADLTVRENLSFYGRIFGLPAKRRRRRIDEILALTGITPYEDRAAGKLSGGWKQRLALGAALMHEPGVLFLDEPTAGIDPVARRDLWDLLFELSARGHTLFVTTHYMDEAERCARIGYIYASKLILLGTPHELKALSEVTPKGIRWVEIVAEPATAALPIARRVPGVRDATIYGEALHLRCESRATPDTIRAAFTEAGFEGAVAVRDVPPSLEDVFVTLSRLSAAASDAHRIVMPKPRSPLALSELVARDIGDAADDAEDAGVY